MDNTDTTKDNASNPRLSFNLLHHIKTGAVVPSNELALQSGFLDQKLAQLKQRTYTTDEVERIISGGTLGDKQTLSRHFFYADGYYQQLITHYATMLKGLGVLIPNPIPGKKISPTTYEQQYYKALDYIDNFSLPILLTNILLRVFTDGAYYGIRAQTSNDKLVLIDLPAAYAQSRYKDYEGRDIVEFNLQYFDKIPEKDRQLVLSSFPKEISKAYTKRAKKGSISEEWIKIPSDIGICFPLFGGVPPLLNVIPASLEYDEAILQERYKEAEDIHKIIVQEIPHLQDGTLLFEPDEAAEIHAGTVGMMKGNSNTSVLTSYGKVTSIAPRAAADRADATLTRMEQNIYAQGGVSSQIFAPTGSNSVEISLDNDLAFLMSVVNKISNYLTLQINKNCGTKKVGFRYLILPITYYNESRFIDNSFKLLGSGYSALLPAMGLGLTQKDLVNIKSLENDVLKMDKILIPLATAYTQSNKPQQTTEENEGGRPELPLDKKSEKTQANEKSIDATGGGS